MIVVTVLLSILLTKLKTIWFRKLKEKLSPRSYPIQCERKYSFFSVVIMQRRYSRGSGAESLAFGYMSDQGYSEWIALVIS